MTRIAWFALAAGLLRLLMEWALGGTYVLFPISDAAMAVAFVWAEVFVLALGLRIAGGAAGRTTENLALAGAAFELLPPIFDRLTHDGNFGYGYVWRFPEGFSWGLASEPAGITPGEAAAWWLLAAFLGAATYARTRHLGRAAAAAVLGYATALLFLAGIPSLAEAARAAAAWPDGHRRTLYVVALVATALGAYAALAPGVRRGLGRRLVHALPFTAVCLAGAAFGGGIEPSAFVYAGVLLLAFTAALAQNDVYDAADDAAQGRTPYLAAGDAQIVVLSFGLVLAALAGTGTLAVVPLLVVLVLSTLYSHPSYRGKRFFPSNLKMEGMWGLSSFTLGLVAAYEVRAYGAPRWWLTRPPDPLEPGVLRAFDPVTLAAMAAVLGGYSLVAVLKDYKDTAADAAAGVQTIYTLAARRGYAVARVHAAAVGASAAALTAAPVLLATAGRMPWGLAAGGPAAGAVLWGLMRGAPSARAFRNTLLLLTLYFAYLAAAVGA